MRACCAHEEKSQADNASGRQRRERYPRFCHQQERAATAEMSVIRVCRGQPSQEISAWKTPAMGEPIHPGEIGAFFFSWLPCVFLSMCPRKRSVRGRTGGRKPGRRNLVSVDSRWGPRCEMLASLEQQRGRNWQMGARPVGLRLTQAMAGRLT